MLIKVLEGENVTVDKKKEIIWTTLEFGTSKLQNIGRVPYRKNYRASGLYLEGIET